MRLVASVLLMLVGIALLARPAGAADEVAVDRLNKKIDNITLEDAQGKPAALHDLKDKKAIVVVFLSFDCPVSNSYTPILAELQRSYGPRQVAFWAVNSSDDLSREELARQVRELQLPFPIFRDQGLRAADAFKVETVPSAFVLDANFVLRYRGRIDNGYSGRLRRNVRTTRHDLADALDAVLAGKSVAEPATEPVGCPLVRSRPTAKTGKVTFYRDVLPILQNSCQQCHRPGEVGPFSLMTYKQAVSWAGDIKDYTRERKMPPWKPVEGPEFRNERRLSEHDINTLAAWVDGGTPAGDTRDAPPPRQFERGWQLGKPDLVLTVPDDMVIDAAGKDLFRCFVLPTGLDEDKYVTAIEVRPGNKRVVHHSLNFFDASGQARALEKKARDQERNGKALDHGPGYSVAMGVGFLPTSDRTFGGLGGWAPGQMPRHLPDGYGYLLPKGADVLLQLHYHRNGRVEKDRTSIGLYFSHKPVQRFKNLTIPGRFWAIPPNNAHYQVEGIIEVAQDCVLRSVMPHMHMLGREIKVTMTPPEGKPMTLVAIKDWDYNWQETYFFKQPIPIKAGTRLHVEAFYDNTAKNPNNPFSPPRWVRFGEQTDDEMCFVFLGATSDQPGRIRTRRVDAGKASKPARQD